MPMRPCWVEISTAALEANVKTLVEVCAGGLNPGGSHGGFSRRGGASVEVLCIVKANAYGHGLELCSQAAVRGGIRWLGVTSAEEGVAVRAFCSKVGFPQVEILVIGGPFPGQGAAIVSHGLTAVVWDDWQLDELEGAARRAGCVSKSIAVHLELDTGMSRQGAGAEDLSRLLARFDARSPLRLGGVMTHLYAADESDGAATREQFAALEGMLRRALAEVEESAGPVWLHVGNSAAVLGVEPLRRLGAIGEQCGVLAMARPGLALYGLAPAFTPEEPLTARELRGRLRRVLEWKTRVVSVRGIEAGAVVGYNGTFVATEPMRVALLAVGYADGLRRELSNRGAVLVRGCRAPIVGRISMDQTVVDVTEIAGVVAGDEVALLGRQGAEEIRAEDHAAWAGTIAWEIFTGIAARVERKGIGIGE